ncbi:hypothetical protein ON010_g12776 [Phytophthora cinnamomi]|nr:hypothetical protein ON010_g12776 [Phytophthora cinnamomi]
MGLHDATGVGSPAHRSDHAVDKRMCNACWAKPDKITGCEHHPRVYPKGRSAKSVEGDALALLTSMELQGPTSWLSDDLFVKYRSEKDRETLWFAFVELKKQQQEIETCGSANSKEQASLAVIPIVTRHPICALFETLQNLENLRTQAETRKRNLTKTFIFDVNHIWLTNLDHFNHQPTRHRILEEAREDESELVDPESRSLSGRRDEQAIREGYSQIQSISSARALKQTVSIGGGPSYHGKMPTSSSQASLMHSASTRRRKAASRGGTPFRPLSLLVCGRWDHEAQPNVLERVPGVTLVGSTPVLWWRYEPDHEVSKDGAAPPEYTKAVALFARNSVLVFIEFHPRDACPSARCTNIVTVVVCMACWFQDATSRAGSCVLHSRRSRSKLRSGYGVRISLFEKSVEYASGVNTGRLAAWNHSAAQRRCAGRRSLVTANGAAVCTCGSSARLERVHG